MKKIVPIMLGVSLLISNANVFARDIPKLDRINDNSLKIQELKNKGIINGYLNGDLALKNSLKRSEVVKLLVSMMTTEDELNKDIYKTKTFSDVNENYWAAKYINYAKINMKNLINGYPDGTFKPENKVTKAELLKLLVAVSDKNLTKDEIKNAKWPSDWVKWAKEENIVDEKFDTSVENLNSISNREFSFVSLYNCIEVLNKENLKTNTNIIPVKNTETNNDNSDVKISSNRNSKTNNNVKSHRSHNSVYKNINTLNEDDSKNKSKNITTNKINSNKEQKSDSNVNKSNRTKHEVSHNKSDNPTIIKNPENNEDKKSEIENSGSEKSNHKNMADLYTGSASVEIKVSENVVKENIKYTKSLPENTIVGDVPEFDNSSVGTKKVNLKLTFSDKSIKNIDLNIKINKKTDKEINSPEPKNITVIATSSNVKLETLIKNYEDLTNVKELKIIDGSDLEEKIGSAGEKKIELKIIYNDDTFDTISCVINVEPIYEIDFDNGEDANENAYIANNVTTIKDLIEYDGNIDKTVNSINFDTLISDLKSRNEGKELVGWTLNNDKNIYTTEELKNLSINSIKNLFEVVSDGDLETTYNTKKLIIKPKFENKKQDITLSIEKNSGRFQYKFVGKGNPNSKISIKEEKHIGNIGYTAEGTVSENGSFSIDIKSDDYKSWLRNLRLNDSTENNIKSFIVTETKDGTQLNQKKFSLKLDSKVVVTRIDGENNFNQGLYVNAKNNTEPDATSSATVNYWPGDKITVHADKKINSKVFKKWISEGTGKFDENNLSKNEFSFITDSNEINGYGFKAVYGEPEQENIEVVKNAPKIEIVENMEKTSNGKIKFKDDIESSMDWVNAIFDSKIIIKKNDIPLTENKNSEYLIKNNEYYISSSSKKLIFKGLNKGDKISITVTGYNEGVYFYDGDKLRDNQISDTDSSSSDESSYNTVDNDIDVNKYKYILKSAKLVRNSDNTGTLTIESKDGKTLGTNDSALLVYYLVDNHTDYDYYYKKCGINFSIKEINLEGKNTSDVSIIKNYMDKVDKDIVIFIKENSYVTNNNFAPKGIIIRLKDIKSKKDGESIKNPKKEDWGSYISKNIKGNNVYSIDIKNFENNKLWIENFINNSKNIKIDIVNSSATNTLAYVDDVNKLSSKKYSYHYNKDFGGSFDLYFSNNYLHVKKIIIKNGSSNYTLNLKERKVVSVE